MTPTETKTPRGIRREHPAYAMIGASRFSGGGYTLFGSPIKHNSGVTITVVKAYEEGDEYSFRQHSSHDILQVTLSEAQWASFVTAMNVGHGVPCTLNYIKGSARVPDIKDDHPLERRSAMIKEKAKKDMALMQEFVAEFDKLLNSKTPVSKAALKELRSKYLLHAVDYAPGAYQYAADMVTEHMEAAVTAARAEVESYVLQTAMRFPGLANSAPQLSIEDHSHDP